VSLERSGVPPEGGQADCLVGRGFVLRVRSGSFAFVFYKFKRVSPGCLGDPHGCPRQEVHTGPTKCFQLVFNELSLDDPHE
jgi:hypothetical protein